MEDERMAQTDREAELEARERALEQREAKVEKAEKARLRDNLYARINIPIKVMDIVIAVVVVLLVAAIVIGILL